MKSKARFVSLLFILLATWSIAHPGAAQNLNPRLGIGFNGMLAIPGGLGVGLIGRASAPVNSDLSFAVDAGFTGFVLGGREDASYVFNPQISAIVTLPVEQIRASYLLGGFGAYVPLSTDNGPSGGPTIHFGAGRVRLLRETTLFYEVDPALIIGENSVHLVIPARIGLIF